MHFIKRWCFTLISIAAAIAVLDIEKIGSFFFLAPPDKFYIDIVVSILLVILGILVDMNFRKLAREKEIERELRQTNAELDTANRALRDSLAKIKVLKGLLPMCGSCKKVRNDKGYWQQIEVYFREHSDAEITHWLCPDCVKHMWQDSSEDRITPPAR
ncbi:MAG: hypothetical protein NT045_02650 [Candidatus Aureabacteria bacterium]|nr:hypothetical protein [Candidatus Auribacterota bacterium]